MPARIPGAARGTATRQNRESSECPSVAAMSRLAGSTAPKAARAATIRNGAAQNVWASTMPMIEFVRCPSKSRPRKVYGPTR